MLKGDLRKKQILDTAEKLFCLNGYEATSVQDILDMLHLSKGSFYHHYESKESLLSCICENRAAASADEEKRKGAMLSGIDGVNRILSAMIPFNGEGLHFLKMILPVFSLPEGQTVRNRYQNALKQAFFPLLLQAFDSAVAAQEVFFDDAAFTAGVCLDLVNDMWVSISDRMLVSASGPDENKEPVELLFLLDQYRRVLERVLMAPFGSLNLIGLEDLNRLRQEINAEKR
jgi:AcrR family transcriptional regulator